MSHYMTALAMRQTGLKPAAKIVLYWLADHHNGETGDCFPSLQRLAKVCEMNKGTVARHLKDLEARGLITRTHRKRENGSQTSTFYTLNLASKNAEPPVAKRDTPCRKTQQPPVAKCDPHNLGRYNLGNEPTPIAPKGADEDFEDFWAVVPKKVGKAAARKAWRKACKEVHPETIIAAMELYARQRQGQDQQYTAHPATWLNAGRWEDEMPTSPQDFHRKLDKLLKGIPDGIRDADAIGGGASEQLSKRLPTPDAPSRGHGDSGGSDDSGGNQRAHLHLIRPKRFP